MNIFTDDEISSILRSTKTSKMRKRQIIDALNKYSILYSIRSDYLELFACGYKAEKTYRETYIVRSGKKSYTIPTKYFFVFMKHFKDINIKAQHASYFIFHKIIAGGLPTKKELRKSERYFRRAVRDNYKLENMFVKFYNYINNGIHEDTDNDIYKEISNEQQI